MGIRDISLQRSVWSYSRVQALVSVLRRNRRWQLRRPGLSDRHYVNAGCGPNVHPDFINVEYQWLPGVDLCWDLRRGLPLAAGSMQGVYTEHCLEHFSLADARRLVAEFFRVMRPGGVLRVAVPDAGLYLETYRRRMDGDATAKFPFEDAVRERDRLAAPMVHVNAIFYTDRDSPAGHRCLFDFALLAELLGSVGFTAIARCGFREGRDPKLLIDSPGRRIESLYVEAVRP